MFVPRLIRKPEGVSWLLDGKLYLELPGIFPRLLGLQHVEACCRNLTCSSKIHFHYAFYHKLINRGGKNIGVAFNSNLTTAKAVHVFSQPIATREDVVTGEVGVDSKYEVCGEIYMRDSSENSLPLIGTLSVSPLSTSSGAQELGSEIPVSRNALPSPIPIRQKTTSQCEIVKPKASEKALVLLENIQSHRKDSTLLANAMFVITNEYFKSIPLSR